MTFTFENLPIRVKKMSTWLAFDLKNRKDFLHMIPRGTHIMPIKVLEEDVAKPRLLFNIYEASSTFFNGRRLEVVTLVRQKKRPEKIHFVVLDCFSDTLQWDPVNGIQMPNACSHFSTLRKKHSLIVKNGETILKVKGELGKKAQMTKAFAVDSNYLCFFRNSSSGVSLDFDPEQIMKPVTLLDNSVVDTNLWSKYRGRLTHSFVHTSHMDFNANIVTLEM